MGYIYAIKTPDNTNNLIEPLLFANADNTSTAVAYHATIAHFALISGVVITFQPHVNNAANASLTIGNSQAIEIYYQGANITANILKANHIYQLIYYNEKWNVIGEKLEAPVQHRLTFGAGQQYVYDGSADVTVPVYDGTMSPVAE